MEFLLLLLVLGLVGVPLVSGLLGVGLFSVEKRGRERAVETADDTLGKLFGDAGETVTYDSRPYDSLEATHVIQGAVGHGYKLVNNDAGVLLFQRG